MKKNITKYKTDFMSQSCHKDQIHISLLHLLYEAQSVKDIRKIILSWYIDVIINHETLNIFEFNMWSELSTAHQNLISESLLSFFLHNFFETSSYSFFTVIHIIDLEFISDVLVERLQWINFVII